MTARTLCRPGYGPNGRRTAPGRRRTYVPLRKPSDGSRIVRHPVYEPLQVLAKTVLLAQRQFFLQTAALAVDGLGTDVQNLRDLRGRQADDNHAAKSNVVDRQLGINFRKAHRQIVVNLIDDPSQFGPALRSQREPVDQASDLLSVKIVRLLSCPLQLADMALHLQMP